MKTVTIWIEFANKKIKAYDHIYDINKAIDNSRLNLFSKYNVRVQNSHITSDEKVVLYIDIPDNVVSKFTKNIGQHLRGISTYLLSIKKDYYTEYKVGQRLLNYIEIPDPESDSTCFTKDDCLNAINSFIKLLKQNDAKSQTIVNRILRIINDSKKDYDL